MKYFSLLILLSGMSWVYSQKNISLENGNSCLNEKQTQEYLNIWKSELLRSSNMSIDYFKSHISELKTSVNCRNNTVSFRVDYVVTIDWAKIKTHDQFIVMLSSKDAAYKQWGFPRDSFLTADQIKVILEKDIYQSAVGPVKPISGLKYKTRGKAIRAMHDSTGYKQILPAALSYYVPGKAPRSDGLPYFLLVGTIDVKQNLCVNGYFNLLTGESKTNSVRCVVE